MALSPREAVNAYMSSPPKTVKSLKSPASIPDPLKKFISAKSDRTDYSELYRLENVAFPTREELKRVQDTFMYGSTTLSQDVRVLEYRWGEIYFEPLTEFMGDRRLWAALGISVPEEDIRSAKSALMRRPVTMYDVAYFSGAHWISRKAGTKEVFDPYDEYQIKYTNQFCQTFSLMYLRDRLPAMIAGGNNNNNNWLKYYAYTMEALKFIDDMIKMCKKDPTLKNLPVFREQNTKFDNLERAIAVCKSHPYMCVNIAKLP